MCMSSDIIQDLAKPNPAGIHSVQYVGRSDISVDNPECDGIERDLKDTRASPREFYLKDYF